MLGGPLVLHMMAIFGFLSNVAFQAVSVPQKGLQEARNLCGRTIWKLHMARRIGSESNTIQAQEIIPVGFRLPAFGGETISGFG